MGNSVRRLRINISNYVKRLKRIGFYQPLFEAATNSLDANAKNIDISVHTTKRIVVGEEGAPREIQFMNGFTVEDDGDGFNDKNIDSFFEMLSEKREEGKLGSGRFIWLKIFKNINIESRLTGKTIKIYFCDNFDEINLDIQDEANTKTYTRITFSELTEEGSKKSEEYIINNLKLLLENYLLAKLQLLKDKKIKFSISIDGFPFITENTIPKFEKEIFYIEYKDSKEKEYKEPFTLYYKVSDNDPNLNDKSGTIDNFYVAHGRKVKDFTDNIKVSQLPGNASSFMMVSSKYFDKNINDDRNDFRFETDTQTEEFPISFKDINTHLETKVSEILRNKIPSLGNIMEKRIKAAIEEHPYLAKQIRKDSAIVATKQQLITRAERLYKEGKKAVEQRFKKVLKGAELPDDEYNKIINQFSEFEAMELGRYIAYRQQIIKHSQSLLTKKERLEKLFHTLFMKRFTRTEKSDNYHYEQNMWLLDDKFMSFNFIASDTTFNQISQVLNGTNVKMSDGGADKPDLFLSFSNEETAEGTDCLIVELKGLGASNDEKNKSITEIANNAGTIREKFKNIRQLFAFIITDVDADFQRTVRNNDYKPFTSKNGCHFYYKYLDNVGTHSYVMPADVMINDANLRNQVFLDLLKKAV